jgi:hypothetical protein
MFAVPSFFGFQKAGFGPTYDADAQAFFDRVTAAGGTLSLTEMNATNQLVLDLKANSLWTPMKAIYPMVGASAAACAQNLKSSSFTGTFTSGWTFASTGVTPNGTSAYFNTTLVPNTSLTFNSISFGVYSTTNFSPTSNQSYGCTSANIYLPLVGSTFFPTKYVTGLAYSFNSPDILQSSTGQDFSGMFQVTRTSATNAKLFRNNTQLAAVTTNSQTTQPTNSFVFGALRASFVPFQDYCNFEHAFAYIGDGLTDTQASNFYTAIQAMQTTLSR